MSTMVEGSTPRKLSLLTTRKSLIFLAAPIWSLRLTTDCPPGGWKVGSLHNERQLMESSCNWIWCPVTIPLLTERPCYVGQHWCHTLVAPQYLLIIIPIGYGWLRRIIPADEISKLIPSLWKRLRFISGDLPLSSAFWTTQVWGIPR